MTPRAPLAVVLGDMDLVRPLGLAGVECAVAVPPGAASRFSRFTLVALDWAHPWDSVEELVQSLIRFARTQAQRPVLFYQSDAELLLVSRNRERLGQVFQFVVPDQTLVEDLVDKERFQKLAQRLSLPVPRAHRLVLNGSFKAADLDLQYPIVLKPLTRRPDIWKTVTATGKARRVNSPAELDTLLPVLMKTQVSVIAQEMIPGPEKCIESYHVYVNNNGEIRGEFTGRKIRTYPLEYGESTALTTTAEKDVAALGRELVKRLNFHGVAKFDFKRGPDGTLHLLEINPRFNLWHHLGAVAGVNLPALVYNDLLGRPIPELTSARAGLTWTRLWQDALAAKSAQLPMTEWLRWSLNCEAKRLLAWDDPMPFVRAGLWRVVDVLRSRLSSSAAARAQTDPGDNLDQHSHLAKLPVTAGTYSKG